MTQSDRNGMNKVQGHVLIAPIRHLREVKQNLDAWVIQINAIPAIAKLFKQLK